MFNRSYIQTHKGHPHYLADSKIALLQKSTNLSKQEEQSIRAIRNLSDPTKVKIYFLLHKIEEISVTDLTLILGLTQSAVSHALSDLKNLGLAEAHRCGQLICYSLAITTNESKFFKLLKKRFYGN